MVAEGDLRARWPALRWLLAAASLVALLRLAAPVLKASYIEGFQYGMSSIGIYLAESDPQQFDESYLLYQQFFTYSRLGVNVLLSLLAGWYDTDLFAPARVLMGTSLLVYLVSTAFFAARVTQTDLIDVIIVLPLLHTPFYSSYFLNDNLPAAAAVATACAVMVASRSWMATTGAAILLGGATCLRIDSLFILPLFALLLLEQKHSVRTFLLRSIVALVIVALLPSLLFYAYGTSLPHILSLGNRMIALWNREYSVGRSVSVLLDVANPVAFLLALVGLGTLLRQRRWSLLVTIAVPSAVFLAMYYRSLYQVRYLLPLLPLATAACVLGFRQILAVRSFSGQIVALCAVLAAIGTSICPGAGGLLEGPRPRVGQLTSVRAWEQWLDALNTSIVDVVQQVRAPQDGVRIVVSSDWNADRLVHFAALVNGYRPAETTDVHRGVERFTGGGGQLIHLRLHVPSSAVEDAMWQTHIHPWLQRHLPDEQELLFVSTRPLVDLERSTPIDQELIGGVSEGAPIDFRLISLSETAKNLIRGQLLEMKGTRAVLGSYQLHLPKAMYVDRQDVAAMVAKRDGGAGLPERSRQVERVVSEGL